MLNFQILSSRAARQRHRARATLHRDTPRRVPRLDLLEPRTLLTASPLEVSSLGGTLGYTFRGIDVGDFTGATSSIGDINGDGIADIAFGSENADLNGHPAVGRVCVVFGGAAHLQALDSADGRTDGLIDLSKLLPQNGGDGTHGFVINGASTVTTDQHGMGFGCAIAAAGDVNQDGRADFLVGAFYADRLASSGGKKIDAAGGAFLFFGKTTFPALVDLARFTQADGYKILGPYANAQAGVSLDAGQDVNGDGVPDLLIGQPSGTTPSAFVLYGGTALSKLDQADGKADGVIDLAKVDGVNGFCLSGINPRDWFGQTVSLARDVNGDGCADVLVVARCADPLGKTDAGETEVFFGGPHLAALDQADGVRDGHIQAAQLQGTDGFRIPDLLPYAGLGPGWITASGAGDVNGDGLGDIVIGVPSQYRAVKGGEAYVVFGAQKFPQFFDLSKLDGTNGFVIDSSVTGGLLGSSVSGVGDVNRDGFDDLLVGSDSATPSPDRPTAGESLVIYGRKAGPGQPSLTPFNVAALDGTTGFEIDGKVPNSEMGWSTASAGDVDGDGYPDMLIGSSFGSSSTVPGEYYLVFGGPAEPRAADDMAVNLLTCPSNVPLQGQVNVTVSVENRGSSPEQNVPVVLTSDGTVVQSWNVGSIPPGGWVTLTGTWVPTAMGNHQLAASVQLAGDARPGNDSATRDVDVATYYPVTKGGAIPDAGTLTSSLAVPDHGTIRNVNVKLNINHPHDPDLCAYLVAPDGTRVVLFTNPGNTLSLILRFGGLA
jgi:hypothetical protein